MKEKLQQMEAELKKAKETTDAAVKEKADAVRGECTYLTVQPYMMLGCCCS